MAQLVSILIRRIISFSPNLKFKVRNTIGGLFIVRSGRAFFLLGKKDGTLIRDPGLEHVQDSYARTNLGHAV